MQQNYGFMVLPEKALRSRTRNFCPFQNILLLVALEMTTTKKISFGFLRIGQFMEVFLRFSKARKKVGGINLLIQVENEDYETDTSSEDEDIDFEELMATKIALANRENIEKRLESCNE